MEEQWAQLGARKISDGCKKSNYSQWEEMKHWLISTPVCLERLWLFNFLEIQTLDWTWPWTSLSTSCCHRLAWHFEQESHQMALRGPVQSCLLFDSYYFLGLGTVSCTQTWTTFRWFSLGTDGFSVETKLGPIWTTGLVLSTRLYILFRPAALHGDIAHR